MDGRPHHCHRNGAAEQHSGGGLAWSAAAVGWLLAEIIPIAVRATLEGSSIARASRLNAERAKLVETWGLNAPPDD